MILAVDMGNTHIELGMIEDNQIIFSERFATDLNKTSSEYAVLIQSLLEIREVNVKEVEGAILSSVVPPLTYEIKEAIKKVIKKTPHVVGVGMKTGINIRIDNPQSLGADILIGCVAVKNLYSYPAIVIDMGTATTLAAINKEGDFIGCAILAGVGTSLNALSNNASKLPKINIDAPSNVIAKNTEEAMQSGIVYGQASLLDGMIEKMEKEIGEKCTVVATGGLARLIVPHCKKDIILDNELNLKGLEILYRKNV